jgi:hypothetical protein
MLYQCLVRTAIWRCTLSRRSSINALPVLKRTAVWGRTLSWRRSTNAWEMKFDIFHSKWPCTLFLVFCSTLLTLLWSLLHEFLCNYSFLSQKTVTLSFLADSICLSIFYLVIHCFDCSLVTVYAQVSWPVGCMMWLRNASPSLWYHPGKYKL